MKQVSVTELKNRLSHYLRMVKRGVSIEIVERSIPIAQITAAASGSGGADARLEQLVRDGIVSRPKRRPGREILDFEPIPCSGDAVKAVIEGRGDR